MRAHWFLPYFITCERGAGEAAQQRGRLATRRLTEALRISSSVFFQTPPLVTIRMAAEQRAEASSRERE
jgi:hypothetical protein